uniref:Uncharacterized protein n=1 Tax=Ditylenchus dipsaci TaxID=166011 RepID=A0A915DCF3_9BILA
MCLWSCTRETPSAATICLQQLPQTRTAFFNITGYDTEFNAIRPYLKISHTCPSIFPEYKNCKFVTEIDLPYREQQDKDTERTLVVPLTGGSTEVNCE